MNWVKTWPPQWIFFAGAQTVFDHNFNSACRQFRWGLWILSLLAGYEEMVGTKLAEHFLSTKLPSGNRVLYSKPKLPWSLSAFFASPHMHLSHCNIHAFSPTFSLFELARIFMNMQDLRFHPHWKVFGPTLWTLNFLSKFEKRKTPCHLIYLYHRYPLPCLYKDWRLSS